MSGQQPGADFPAKTTSGEPSAQRPSEALKSQRVGDGVGSRAIPAPEEFPQAPPRDLVTLRVIQVNAPGRRDPYYISKAYLRGVEIGQSNASSREAALAGAVAAIESTWRAPQGRPEKKPRS